MPRSLAQLLPGARYRLFFASVPRRAALQQTAALQLGSLQSRPPHSTLSSHRERHEYLKTFFSSHHRPVDFGLVPNDSHTHSRHKSSSDSATSARRSAHLDSARTQLPSTLSLDSGSAAVLLRFIFLYFSITLSSADYELPRRLEELQR